MKDPLVIYGGSFDPIHEGHLRIARRARDYFEADVLFVPAYAPRWKKPEASFAERLTMLRRALKNEGSPSFAVSEIEGKRKGEVSYTVDTVREMKRLYPGRDLILLIGSDEANSFPRWKDPEEIARLASIYYVPREGVEVDDSALRTYDIHRLEGANPGAVSSSGVRSLSCLDVPYPVLSYIVERKLYFMKKLAFYLDGHRLEHSISVASLAYSIALHSRLERPDLAFQAGLLHDIGKNVGEVESRDIVSREYPAYRDYPGYALHQWVGAYLAKKDFKVLDPEVIEAIAYHCTGKPHMTPLQKIVYSADKIEPGRGYDTRKLIRSCLSNYYVGFLAVLKANRAFLKKQGSGSDNALSEQCMDLYLGKDRK